MVSPEGITPQHSEVIPALSTRLFRLEQTYGAYHDMHQAEALASGISQTQGQERARGVIAGAQLDIADAKVALGLDPSDSFKEVLEVSRELGTGLSQVYVLSTIAGMYAAMGSFGIAMEIARTPVMDSSILAPEPGAFLKVAQEARAQGHDARGIVEEAVLATNNRNADNMFDHQKVAVALQEVGGDAKGFIDAGVDFLNKNKGRDPRIYDYKCLAEAYASIGHFDEATGLIALVGETGIQEKDYKRSALAFTACRQVEAGQYDEALQTALSTEDQKVYAEIASYISSFSGDSARIAEAETLVDAYERSFSGHPNSDYKYRDVGEMLAFIAKGKAVSGEDPDPFFQQALAKNSLARSDNQKVATFIQIARIQRSINRDGSPALSMAIAASDDILTDPRGDDAFRDAACIIAVEDVADAALDLGHNGIFEVAFKKLDNDSYDETDTKIRLLAKRSKLRAKQGFTQKQLQKLTPDDKGDLIKAGGQKVRHALSYIELGIDTEAQTQGSADADLAALREQFNAIDRLSRYTTVPFYDKPVQETGAPSRRVIEQELQERVGLEQKPYESA